MGDPPAAKTFYVTTPIYYVNDVPHIGHAYTTLAADVLARYHRLRGREVFFLTGTDEHGQKVQRSAAEQGLEPIELADRTVERFQAVWEALHISNDDFIRTTEPRHRRAVEAIFRRIDEAGDIYPGEYEGLYCVPCETFWTELQVGEGGCPSCGRPVETVREKSYFFRMSRYEKRLLEHIERHPEFIQPESRRNEILSFVRQGLRDLSISRTTFDWGLPVPTDPSHVLYVWFDALTNYLTAPGLGTDPERFERIWPADVHLIGKDILRFHAVYWPTFLMAAGLPLPRVVFGHGWWTVEGQKMSKSLRNVVDPLWLIETYGVDAVRYFLLREVSFGADGDFSHRAFIGRLNADLANDLGNLLSRTVGMIQKYCDGVVPEPSEETALEAAFRERAESVMAAQDGFMAQCAFQKALINIFELVAAANKYVDETAPFKLAKREADRSRLRTVLYTLAEGLRFLRLLVDPYMPTTAAKIGCQLGIPALEPDRPFDEVARWGGTEGGQTIHEGPMLFPRIEEDRAAAIHEEVARLAKAEEAPPEEEADVEEIGIEEFQRVSLRAARIVAAEPVPKSKKLLKLTVEVGGGEQRQLVAGIAQDYTPEALVGKSVVVVTNLKPARLMGVESQGMVLAGETPEGKVVLATFDEPLEPGCVVK
ncbi:MAG: methionine--tRNA ligase [bacterium]|nr:methionine--tRNA ligase [bacterium]